MFFNFMTKIDENKVVNASIRLPIKALNTIDDLVDEVKAIKRSKNDRSATFKQDIHAECIYLGAKVFKEELRKVKK